MPVDARISTKRGLWANLGSAEGPPVYVAPLAEFFHCKDCELCGEPRSPVSRKAALERGLKACPVCAP